MSEQTSLFDFAYPPFKFAKPVRLIELFAGYGSQMMAMKRLQKEGYFPCGLESWRICEWAIPSFVAWAKIHNPEDKKDYSEGKSRKELAKILADKGVSLDWKTPTAYEKLKRKPEAYLRQAYNAMVSSRNVVDITRAHASDFGMEDREKYDVVMTWSFPCQSLSLAGKRAGMDEGSGSESSLGYEVLRLLDEMKAIDQLPDVLVMENVPQFASKANRQNVMIIQDRLDRLGYKSYIKIQSATDFGVPQTRKRCFMFSFLGDYSYTFPCGFPLTLKLKDKLEDNVDQKYYLSRKMMRYVLAKPTKNYGQGLKEVINPSTARTINANYGRYRAGIDTYVSPDCEEDKDLTIVNSFKGLPIKAIGGLPIKDATKQGFDYANEGDGVYISNINGKRGTVQRGMIQTIKAGNDVGVVVSVGIDKSSNNPKRIDVANCITARENRGISKHKSEGTAILEVGSNAPSIMGDSICLNPKGGRGGVDGLQPSLENRVYDPEGCAVALATGFQPKYAIGADGRIDLSAVYVTDEKEPRFLVWDGKEWRELRIRRLTPRECFRLQDVSDADFDLIKDFLSESTLYHLAGDSICVANLYYDFRMMCKRKE